MDRIGRRVLPIQRSKLHRFFLVPLHNNNNTISSIIIHIHCITSSGVWMNDKETIENPLRAGQFFYSCTVWRVPLAISSVYGTIKGGRTHTQPTSHPVCEHRPRRYRYLEPSSTLSCFRLCAGRKDWIVLHPRRGNTTPRGHHIKSNKFLNDLFDFGEVHCGCSSPKSNRCAELLNVQVDAHLFGE